jgi:hypothetical protein
MYVLSQKDTRTDRERYLEDELASEREQREREYENKEQARKRREHEYRAEQEHEMRQANDWLDALNKQIILCQREISDGEEDENFIVSKCNLFFQNTADACRTAQKLWREVEASKRGEISAIRESIRLEVADKLKAADERTEFDTLQIQLRNNELESFLDW